MKVQNTQTPPLYRIDISGDNAIIRLTQNVVEKQINSVKAKSRRNNDMDNTVTETTTVYEYDCYTLTTKNRAGLEVDISKNTEQWLEKAKQAEIEKLSTEIRNKRNALLAECDADVALDRLNLVIPDKITASTLLAGVKSVFEGLSSVLNGDMARYRQALRDIPQQEGFPYNVKFPIKPNKH